MPPRKAPEKPIFKDLVIALAGPIDGQWTDVNIARWVSQRAGRFAAQMDASVTHLVCSEEAFKARGPRVKEALSRPRSCYIVTKDWLEDSITRKRRLDEEGFVVNKAEQERRRRKKEEKRQEKRQEKEEALAVRAVNPHYWHTYRDGTFFRYEVVISRVEEEVERRFELSLYESNASPHLYWFVAKFFKRKGDSQPNYYRPSDAPGRFWREFGLFEHFFEKKTGIPWEKRLVLCTAAAARANGVKKEESADGDSRKEIWYKLEDEGRRFVYEPPTGGKPVGWAPPEFIPIVVEDVVLAAGQEVKAPVQTPDIPVGVAAQAGSLDEADVVMVDASEDETVKTDNDEKNTPDTKIKDVDVKEEQDGDTDMTMDTRNKATGAEETQGDAVMKTETNTQGSDTSVDEAQEATATLTDTKTQRPKVEETEEATAMAVGLITQCPNIEEIQEPVQEATAIMDSDAVTKGANVNDSQEIAEILTDVKTEDTSVDRAQEDAAMSTDSNIKDTSVEKVQRSLP